MNLLVVGGAGYIGSHMTKKLALEGHSVTVLDDFSTGFFENLIYGRLVQGCLSDTSLLESVFSTQKIDCVLHFAAFSLVGESVDNPGKYYRNNVVNTLNLLDVMVRYNVNKIVFSSTAATFGEPLYSPIDEKHPQTPINPYGASKLMVERMLSDYFTAYGVNSVALRYFNACGADPEGEIGECHDPETHLIPLALQAASGRRSSITIFGRDYPTADGTCIRDYIHIEDLCSAHALALKALTADCKKGAFAYNLGNGQGYSVQQVIEVVQQVVSEDGFTLKLEEGARRLGDPAVLVADATLAKQVLGWKPEYSDLNTIVRHAWAWEKKCAFH